jgi:hypothetical protein
MNERKYINFDLVIEQKGDRYRARVLSSPAGQAEVEFDSLFSPLELENFVLRMGRPQRGMRRIDSTEMATIKNFGTRLFRTVFNDDVYACYLRSIDNTLNQDKGLRIRLRINVPEFHDLPWEYLYNPQFDQFLALSKDTPIIRYIELPYSTRALPVKTPMKILVMISSPDGYPALDVEKEWDKLNRALKPLIDQDLVILDKLEHPTLSGLQKRLRQEQVHIFHYIGHGKYFEDKQDGMLLLEDEHRRGKPTSGQHLGAILHDHHQLRLVVLNACEGARTSAEDPYAGVAQTLVRQGIPAVLAMQFEIFEDAAMTLAQEFYSAIVDGYPVDAALSEARKAIFASNNDVEWGTPVLFMRTPNGVLFRPETPAEKEARLAAEREAAEKVAREKAAREAEQEKARKQRLSKLKHLYDQAKIQMEQGDWPATIEFLLQIQGIEPDYRDVPALLEQAEAELEAAEKAAKEKAKHEAVLAKAYDEAYKEKAEREAAEKAAKEKAEREAVLAQAYDEAYEEKAEREVAEKDAREKQAHLEKLYKQGNQKSSKQEWAAAIELFTEIEQIEPGFRNVNELLNQAQTELEQGEKVKNLFEAAQVDMAAEQWSQAIAGYQAVLELEPAHTEARRQLDRAKIGLENQSAENQKKKKAKASKKTSRATKPSSYPEEIKPLKPGSNSDESKPRNKPRNLPK